MEENRVADRVLVGKLEGKKSLGKPRTKYKKIKMGAKEIGLEDVDCIIVTSERDKWSSLVNTVMNLGVRYSAGIFITNCRTTELFRIA